MQVALASEVNYISTLRQLLWQSSSPGRCGVTFSDCCCGSRDVAASHSQTAVAAAGTLRRHTLRLLLRQQGRCGVTFAHCCCGSRDVEASFWQTAVASAGTLPVVVTSHQFLRRSQRRACDEAPQNRGGARHRLRFQRKPSGFRICRGESASVSAGWLLATCDRVAYWRG